MLRDGHSDLDLCTSFVITASVTIINEFDVQLSFKEALLCIL